MHGKDDGRWQKVRLATHRAASCIGKAAATSPRPPVLDQGATSVVTHTTYTENKLTVNWDESNRLSTSP